MKTMTMPTQEQETSHPKTRGQILLIEDNEKNRKLVRSLLRINNYSVIEASDAESGIQLAKKFHPDLVLMDIQLPGMDGLQATEILKKDKDVSSINIVALTSHAMEGDSQKALAAGCNGYLTKPINTREFIRQISAYLPQKSDETPARQDAPTEKESEHTTKILIVDDEPRNLKLLRGKLLKKCGKILEALNGKEALSIVKREIPDLILTDIMMPEMDGFELTRLLKGSAKTSHIPIILITALDGHNYKVMGYEAGADDFLNKPVNTIELNSRVKSLLDLKRCQDKVICDSKKTSNAGSPVSCDADSSLYHKTILMMLDDENKRNTIKMYLSGQPFDIKCESVDAWDVNSICRQSADILVVDDSIFAHDYAGLFRTIKENQKMEACQLLYLTDECDLKKNFNLIEYYVDDFLTQPYNIYELRARIKVLIKKKMFIDRLTNPSDGGNLDSAIKDQPTGLYTFEYCKHVLKHELQRSIREHSNVAFVNMAVQDRLADGYASKALSDEDFIKTLGRFIGKSIRKLDIASYRSKRLFSFVLPEADEIKTKGFIDRIRNLICNHLNAQCQTIAPEEKDFLFGYSICPNQSDQVEEMIQIADAALAAQQTLIG